MKEAELNSVDRFLYKLLICTFLLLGIVFLNKLEVISIEKMQTEMSQHFNLLTILKAVNGEHGVLLPIEISEEVSVSTAQTYIKSEVMGTGRKVKLGDFEGVEIYKAGIIVKIQKNADKTYEVTVKGIDNYEYVYNKLETCDHNIYKMVHSGDILGLPSSKSDYNYFEFFVYDKGQVISLFP